MNIYNEAIPLAAMAVNLAVGGYVISRDPLHTLNRLAAACMISLAFWGLGQFIMTVAETGSIVMLGARIASLGWCTVGALFAHLCMELSGMRPSSKYRTAIAVLYGSAVLLTVLAWSTGLVFAGFDLRDGKFFELPGPLRLPAKLYVIILLAFGLSLLFRERQSTPSVFRKTQLGFMIVAAMIPVSFGVVNDTILPLFERATPLSAAAVSPLMSLLLAYAMTRHDLMTSVVSRFGSAVIENIKDAVFITDADNNIEMANPGALDLTGCTWRELEDEPLERFLPELEDAGGSRDGDAMDETRGLRWFTGWKGERIPVTAGIGGVTRRSGRNIGSVVVLHDMRPTLRIMEAEFEARRAEATAKAERDSLLRSHDDLMTQSVFMEGIIESVAEPLFIKNRDYRFVHVNRALCELIGLPREQVIGKTDYDFFPRAQADFFREKDIEVFSTGEVVVVDEEPIDDSYGSRHILRTLKAPLKNEDGQVEYLVAIISDITSRKELEQLRLDFIRTAAHELRTPLTSLMLGLDALTRETSGALDREQQRSLEVLSLSIQRMDKLAGNLLDLANLDAGLVALKMDDVELEVLLAELAALFEAQARKKGLLLETGVSDGDGIVHADSDRLFQVLHNLVGNAVKYTDRGRIAVSARPVGDGFVEICVSDSGSGIPLAEQGHVFSRFSKIDGVERSTGLGLSIAQALVEAHGGRIWLESVPGSGSSFFFTIPAGG